MSPPVFDLQGHRGARGLKPENTLAGFEAALDAGVTTIETDVHLTRDGIPVLFHDAWLSERLCRVAPGDAAPDPASRPLLSSLTWSQLRSYRADRNADPIRFPDQEARASCLAQLYAERHGVDPFAVPGVADLFAFARAYAGEEGIRAGKTEVQRQRARDLRFDLELKRIPFHPEVIGDSFAGDAPGLLEEQVVAAVREAGVLERTVVRSFDHRCVRAVRRLEPRLTGCILVAGTAPLAPGRLARAAEAEIYGPEYHFLDRAGVRAAHAEGVRVVPWTVNDPEAWRRLLDWEVDGITTDYPDRLAALLDQRGIRY